MHPVVSQLTKRRAESENGDVRSNASREPTQQTGKPADTYRPVNPHAQTMAFPSHLRLGDPLWSNLRLTYYDYLKEAQMGEPIWMYVEHAVPEEDAKHLLSEHRRYIELEVDVERLQRTFDFTITSLKAEIPSFRDTAATVLHRLASAHLGEGSPHVEVTFQAALWLFDTSRTSKHIGNRNLAAKIMHYTNPYLPETTPDIYRAAQLLRVSLIESERGVVTIAHAYRGLIHLFAPDHIEVNEGIATFEGLAETRLNGAVNVEARTICQRLTELQRSLPQRLGGPRQLSPTRFRR